MKQKGKIKRFFTLNPRHQDGFTLVELIVVIAIMAILAGVGSVGYAGYIKTTNKNKDRILVGNIMRAIETAAYSDPAAFSVTGQYSSGLQTPVGFVIISDEILTGNNGETGYMVAVSNDTENHPVGQALTAAFGTDYNENYKLTYSDWECGTVGGSTLHNATAGMMDKIDSTGKLMVALQDDIPLTEDKYEDTGDLITTVAGNISDYDGDGLVTDNDKTAFVQKWLAEANTSYSSVGFGMGGRENYSAVRLAYNNSFAEYVRANYEGTQNADTLANNIANYGQSAGDLAYDAILETTNSRLAASIAKGTANTIAPDAVFSYTANATAFNDPNYPGYGDEDLKSLYDEWLAGPAARDAALFYDTMLTCASDGSDYYDKNGSDDFVDWFCGQAEAYSNNLNNIQNMVNGKNAIVVSAYFRNGQVEFEVFSAEADPRND